jgi:zinc protease
MRINIPRRNNAARKSNIILNREGAKGRRKCDSDQAFVSFFAPSRLRGCFVLAARLVLCLLAVCVLSLAAKPAFAQTTAPSAGEELLTPKSQLAGNGAEAARLVSQRDEIISVLHNGMTVIAKRVPSPVVAVRGYTLAGGVYEGKWLGGGLSHLLEHLCAGGSNDRRTEEQNRNLLQAIGNNSNAYTSTDHTAYFVDTTTDHLDEAVDLVTGWMLTAQITEPEYRREYQVVQRELEMDKGKPDYVFDWMTNRNRYRVNATGIPVIGYQEVIQGLKLDDVRTYYHMAYQPNNMVFVVAGDLDPEAMLKVVEKNVADAKPGRVFAHDSQPEPEPTGPRTLVATFPKLGQARLELAFRSVQLDQPDLYTLDLLATVLGGSESAILTEVIRDQKQLASSISVDDNTPSYVAGTFAIDLECDPANIPAVTQAVMDELQKARSAPLDPERIARAKTLMRMQHLQSIQTSDGIAGTMATDFFQTGDAHFSDHYVDRVDAVTAEQLQDAARRYLDPAKLLTTALIPSDAAGAAQLPSAVDLFRPAPATAAIASTQQSTGAITRVVLPNGVVLLHKFIATTPLISIKMYTQGGVSTEDAANNGIGNLTMQMLARGTATRSADQIAEFLESIGASIDAGCGNNSWFWEGSCLKGDIDKTMDVFADVVNNAAFSDAELVTMKQRIGADIANEDSDWTDQAMRFFKKSYFGPLNSPHQFLPIGTLENLQKLTAADLKKWYHDKILAGPRVLAIFGDIPLDSATALATKYLGAGAALPGIENEREFKVLTTSSLPTPTPSIQVERVEVQKTEQPLAGIVIGFDSNSVIHSPQEPVLTLADCLTSGYSGGSGYLYDVLRGKGLVYMVETQDVPSPNPAHPGTFIAYAGCDPSKVNEVVDLILENMARLQGSAEDIQTDWFDRSRQLIITADALENETPDAQASTAALDELCGLGFGWHTAFADRINAVKLDQVQNEARTVLSKCVLTICTPAPELLNEKAGTREYKSFPRVDLTPRGVQHDMGTGGGK